MWWKMKWAISIALQSSLTRCNPRDCSPPDSSIHVILQERIWSCHALLQGIFPTQGSNLCLLRLLHWHSSSLPLAPSGKFHVTWLKRNPFSGPLLFPPSHRLEGGCAHDIAWSRMVPSAWEHVIQERNSLCSLSHCVLGSRLQHLALYPNTEFCKVVY